MLRIEEDAPAGTPHGDTLTLPFELRQKSRLRARLDGGREVGLFLPRGRVLRDGDLLRGDDGTVVKVQAAVEEVSTASAGDPGLLARAAYHLGNRHVALQVGAGWVRYQYDHVLDEMVRGLGLAVSAGREAFEPEGGAYGHAHDPENVNVPVPVHVHDPEFGHGHGHGHGHVYGHGHPHQHKPRRLLLRRRK
jgi:urease accessory protein